MPVVCADASGGYTVNRYVYGMISCFYSCGFFLRGVELTRRSGYGYGPCMAGHGLGMDTAPVWLDMVWVWIRPIHDPCTVGYDRCTAGYG